MEQEQPNEMIETPVKANAENTEAQAKTEASPATTTSASSGPEQATKSASQTETQGETQAEPTAEAGSTEQSKPKVGEIVTGTITRQVRQMAFVILESGEEAYINISELRDDQGEIKVTPGETIEAKIVNNRNRIELSRSYIYVQQELEQLKAKFEYKAQIEGLVTGVNKGGFEVRVGQINAFCPRSRFSVRPERNPQQQVKKVLSFVIEEFKGGNKPRVVLSRLPILEEAERARGQLMAERFNVGDVIQGRVTRLAKFGAFVDVGDQIEGLIPIGEMSHGRTERAGDVVQSGSAVDVKVISVDPQRGRLSLSIRALTPDPWQAFTEENPAGTKLTAQVTRLTDFGAFMRLAEHVEGLLHVSAISATSRVNHPSEHLTVGQEVEIVIQEILPHKVADKRRIRLMTKEVADRRRPLNVSISVGDVLKAPVKEVNERGLTLTLADGLEGFVPSSETGTQRGANLKERFSIGQEVEVKVMTADLKRRRVRLSIKALENHEEEMAFKSYREEMKSESSRMTSTFGDLLKNFQ